ncbi:MAG: hypothetical protein NTY35_13710 [Planctomycetota bacterium]|nr:hypothetical protein [Planctomycetota bacterium]
MKNLLCARLWLAVSLSCIGEPALAVLPPQAGVGPAAALPPAGVAAVPQPAEEGLRFETIAPGVHLIWTPPIPGFERRKAKVVVAEFDTFTALIEAPWDDRSVRQILRTIELRIPGKPVRFALHSHHHDHSIQAVDPLLAAGATIVTSPWNLEELVKLTADEGTLRRRAIVVKDRFEIGDRTNRLIVHVLRRGPAPDGWDVPTPEYMVFEVPERDLLVSGCLYNKPKETHEVISGRKRALSRFISEKGVSAGTLVPTNTTSELGFEDVCTLQMLHDSLIEGLDPAEVSRQWGAVTAEEMRARLGEIVQEHEARKTRAFDFLVCQSKLVVDGRPGHALVWLDAASRLHPSDPYLWYESGNRAWELGQFDDAERRWARAVDAARDAIERGELREGIDEKRAGK